MKVMKVLITSLILILLIVYLFCCINGLCTKNLNNDFVENFNINNKENCDSDINNINVIVAPNLPMESNTNYITGFNADKFKKLSKNLADNSGKFCFPIIRYKYDGIWTDVDNNSNNNQKKEWVLPVKDTKFVDSQYCTDKFLHLPNKKINPGDVIMQPSDSCIINNDNPIYCKKPTCQDYSGVYKV